MQASESGKQLSDLNHRLAQVLNELARRDRLRSSLESLSRRLENETARRTEMESDLRREDSNVQALEKLSVKGLVYTLLGSKRDQLKTSRQRRLAARMGHARSQQVLATLNAQIEESQAELEQFKDLDEQYRQLMAHKEALLLEQQDATAERLFNLLEQMRLAHFKIEKIGRVVETGQQVQEGLKRVAAEIEDIDPNFAAFGNQLLVKVSHREHIAEAWMHIRRIEPLMGVFQRELESILPISDEITVDIQVFQKTSNAFLRGLQRDAPTPPRIAQTINSALAISRQIDRILSDLASSLVSVEKKLGRLSEEKRYLVESAS